MPHARISSAPFAGAVKRTVTLGAILAIALSLFVGSARPAEAATLYDLRSAVVKLTNVARATKGCKPLKVNYRLTKAAQYHARSMSEKNFFSHTSANGTVWHKRIRNFGYSSPAGENIAYGFLSAAGVLKGWMNSPGHKRNIMDCNFRYIGVGYAANGKYWVQDFGY
jgi:uncharacterized protein YkwD